MLFCQACWSSISDPFRCDVCLASFTGHIYKNNSIYKQVQNPWQVSREASGAGSFNFKLCPHGVSGTCCDGLDEAQETYGAEGITLATLSTEKSASKVTEEMPPCVGETFRKECRDIGKGQEPNLRTLTCILWSKWWNHNKREIP